MATNIQVTRLASTVERLSLTLEGKITMNGVLHHEYKSSGTLYTVDTVKEVGETDTHWKRRHLDEIVAAWAIHEPD